MCKLLHGGPSNCRTKLHSAPFGRVRQVVLQCERILWELRCLPKYANWRVRQVLGSRLVLPTVQGMLQPTTSSTAWFEVWLNSMCGVL